MVAGVASGICFLIYTNVLKGKEEEEEEKIGFKFSPGQVETFDTFRYTRSATAKGCSTRNYRFVALSKLRHTCRPYPKGDSRFLPTRISSIGAEGSARQ